MNIKRFVAKVLPWLGVAIALPQLAFAYTCPAVTSGTIEGVICEINNILNILVPILITLGVVYFIWGVIQYVAAKDEEGKKAARGIMISGIIGLFVIVSIWGLIALISKTFGTGYGGNSVYTAPSL